MAGYGRVWPTFRLFAAAEVSAYYPGGQRLMAIYEPVARGGVYVLILAGFGTLGVAPTTILLTATK